MSGLHAVAPVSTLAAPVVMGGLAPPLALAGLFALASLLALAAPLA